MKRGTLIGLVILGAIGAVLAATGILPGWQLIVLAAILILGIVFERSAYHRAPPAKRNLQSTGEVFEDPVSKKTVKVLFDPQSGERYYDDSGT
ncbi:MAG: hypothetical protein WBX11_13080 [Thiobacillaceae bacterium]